MNITRVAVIGAGWIAKQHLETLRMVEGIEVVGICSRTRAKAEELAKEYAIKDVADSVEELVQISKPDALMVLVSVDQMYPVTDEALVYHLPLFVEKPAGMLPEQNHVLAQKAIEQNIRTMVGFNRRYYSIFHKGIEIVKQHGALLGVVIEGHERMWRVREGEKFSKTELDNWIYANSVHTIDLLRFFGGEPSNIHAITHRQYGEYRGDQFAAVMELESGALGNYSAHWYSPGGWRVVLYGEGVTVDFQPLEKGVWIDRKFDRHEIVPDDVDVRGKPGFIRQMEAFRDLVQLGKFVPPMQDLAESYHTMALAQAMTIPPADSFSKEE